MLEMRAACFARGPSIYLYLEIDLCVGASDAFFVGTSDFYIKIEKRRADVWHASVRSDFNRHFSFNEQERGDERRREADSSCDG